MAPDFEPVNRDTSTDAHARVLEEISASLHDMCQPLTALQCRLEIGQMFGTAEAYAEAVEEALRESERLLIAVSGIREMVRHAREQAQG